jgi:hypothetical protein
MPHRLCVQPGCPNPSIGGADLGARHHRRDVLELQALLGLVDLQHAKLAGNETEARDLLDAYLDQHGG